jgi:hypothetical protein
VNSPQKEFSEKSLKAEAEEIPNIPKDQSSSLLNREIRIPILDLSKNSIIISRKGSDDRKSSKVGSMHLKPEPDDGNHNILQFPDMGMQLRKSFSHDLGDETPSQRSKGNSDESFNDVYDSESLKSENIEDEPLNELAIETSDSLRNIPKDCMNILVKLMINPNEGIDFKISKDVVEGFAFPFNMSFIGLQSEVKHIICFNL